MNKILSFDVNDLKVTMLALSMASDVMNEKTREQIEQGSFGDAGTFMSASWEFNDLIVRIGEFLPSEALAEEGDRMLKTARENIKKFKGLENEAS